MIRTSFLVPTRGCPRQLRRLLKGLVQRGGGASDLETIVLLNGEGARSKEACEAHTKSAGIPVLCADGLGF